MARGDKPAPPEKIDMVAMREGLAAAEAAIIQEKIQKWIDDGKLEIRVVDAPGEAASVTVKQNFVGRIINVHIIYRCDMEGAAAVGDVQRMLAALAVPC